ncbi:(4Fe-4S)-binding protein, partial [Halobacteriales archaeon QH_1_68_42]
MIGILKSMATTMKHALDGETFTVEYPEDEPDV